MRINPEVWSFFGVTGHACFCDALSTFFWLRPNSFRLPLLPCDFYLGQTSRLRDHTCNSITLFTVTKTSSEPCRAAFLSRFIPHTCRAFGMHSTMLQSTCPVACARKMPHLQNTCRRASAIQPFKAARQSSGQATFTRYVTCMHKFHLNSLACCMVLSPRRRCPRCFGVPAVSNTRQQPQTSCTSGAEDVVQTNRRALLLALVAAPGLAQLQPAHAGGNMSNMITHA